MKKYIYRLFMVLLATATMTSCKEDEGTEPGNDPAPSVLIYQYQPEKPYNPDNDVMLRFATNNKTAEVYYLAEKAEDKESHITSMGKEGYKDYVIENGTKLSDVSGESNVDVTLTGFIGEYVITAVAVNGGAKTSSETTFIGLEWNLLGEGYLVSEMFGDVPVEIYKGSPKDWYKIPSMLEDGKDFVIKLSGTNATIEKQDVWTHPNYGSLYAEGAGVMHEGQIVMKLTYTVAVGSFGEMTEVLILPNAQ